MDGWMSTKPPFFQQYNTQAAHFAFLTNARVPPEHVPVKDVEGEMAETPRDFTVKVFAVERTGEGKTKHEGLYEDYSCKYDCVWKIQREEA